MIDKKNYISILEKLLDVPTDNSDESELIRLSIERVLRKYTEERPPLYLSEQLIEKAKMENVNLDIKRHGSVHRINEKIKITLDHAIPINELISELKMTSNVANVIERDFTIAILRSEDEKLNKNGYRRKRNSNWRNCYQDPKVDIKVLRNKDYLD